MRAISFNEIFFSLLTYLKLAASLVLLLLLMAKFVEVWQATANDIQETQSKMEHP
ncbi:MAG: hypothetical protein F6K31_41880 [Symploca sp. SIO2G7]|nr:hypothetical protein [Symploca sp. SIO2G7]